RLDRIFLTDSMTDGSKECDDNPENEVRRHTVTPLRALVPECAYRFEDRASADMSRLMPFRAYRNPWPLHRRSTTASIRFWDQGVLLCHYSHKRMGSEIRRHMFGPDGSSPSRRTRRIRTANPPHAHATGPRRPEVRAPLPVQR